RLLRKRRATPRARALPATFADAVVVADVVEKPATGAGAGRVRTAARFAAKNAVRRAANLETNLETNNAMNVLVVATVRDAADRTRDSRGRRRPLALAATTITDRPRDINRSCFPANRSRSTNDRGRVRIKTRFCRRRVR